MLNRQHHLLKLMCIFTLISGCERKEVDLSTDTDGPAATPKGKFTPARITLKEHGDLKELVDESLTFHDPRGINWIAPQGTLTDGASVPRLALPITDGRWDERFLKAAVVHDAYCQKENETRSPDQYRTRPWQEVHRMFYEACIAGDTPPLKAKIMSAAVWWAGPRWNDPERELRQVSGDMLTRGFVASKQFIEQNDPTVEEIEKDIERREPLLLSLVELENAILYALEAGDKARADALLRGEEALLVKELEKSPNDLMLLNFKGYWHKNQAQLYWNDKKDEELRKAEQTFEDVIESEPRDPSALNGLGSVWALRGDLDRAEQYVRKALAIAPNYQAAKHDLRTIEEERLRRFQR